MSSSYLVKWSQYSKKKIPLFLIGLAILSMPAASAVASADLISTQMENMDEWTRSLALQAAAWGAPLVTMHALRHNDAVGPSAKSKPNTIWNMDDISTPELSKKAGYVTPNVNVIYGFGFMDLRNEPIILEAPDSNNRYYMVEIVDMWTNAFAYVGGVSTGYKGGKFALVGPQWKGELPSDVQRIDCPTPWVLLQPRVHIYFNGKLDFAGASKILTAIKTIELSAYKGLKPLETAKHSYIAPEVINPNHPVSFLEFKDPLQFWEILAEALTENPPPIDQINALLPMYKGLGIEIGKPWDHSKLSNELIQIMKETAQKIGFFLNSLPIGTNYHGAIIPPSSIGNFGTDYLTRAIIARIGLTANTPSETIYWTYFSDDKGHILTGEKKYTITFKEAAPFYEPGFWSITMYSAENNYTAPNPINRYMLGSDTKDLKKNEDGSFTIYIQSTNPGKDKESNWLPAPSGLFYLIPRVYAPKPEIIRILKDPKAWPVPEVKST